MGTSGRDRRSSGPARASSRSSARPTSRRRATDPPPAAPDASFYQAVVERAAVGVMVMDLDGRLVDVNPFVCGMLGRSREELVGTSAEALALPDDPAARLLEREQVLAGHGVVAVRRVRRPDGTIFVGEYSARRLDEGRVVAVVTDITERGRTEQRLAESEHHLERAQELAHFGTWEADLESNTAHWSAETCRIFGVAPDAGPVTYEQYEARLHPEDREGIVGIVQGLLSGGAGCRDYEHRIVRPDGTVRMVHATIDSVRDGSGRVVRLLGSVQDITERRLLEQQLREAQKLEAIGRLAGGVAHDFNNLLTVILGYTETLLEGLPAGDERRASAEQVRTAALKAAGLTQQLLAFGRRQVFRLQVFDLNAVLEEMREILRRLIGERVEIVVAPRARRSLIRADRGQIEQVVLNLALNARDAMPGGGRLEIATGDADTLPGAVAGLAAGAGPWLVLAVSDTGEGMSPEVQAHIFEPFYTTKEVGRGTGLGLATVYGIVNQTGGHVEVSSAPGEGTRFRIYLPCAREEGEAAEAAPVVVEDAGTETVLLVEDEEAVRTLMGEVLRRRGYRVIEAASGNEALATVARLAGPVDLLVTDVVMPGMTGRELSGRLLEARPGLKVLLVSGYGDQPLAPEEMPAGAAAFLQKPFTPNALAHRVRTLLDGPGEAGGRP